MTFNTAYLNARKNVRVTKRGPGEYAAYHKGMGVMALGKKRELAVMVCAMRATKQLTQ